MNHFLALKLDDASRDRLATHARRLQEWLLPAHWTHVEDYHLTLLFLGQVDADEMRTLPYSIEPVAHGLRAPRLRFAGLGAIGGRTEPRVVYAALSDADEVCAHASRDLAETLGVEGERRFLPHVTLCRPRPPMPGEREVAGGRRDWPQLLEANGLADWGTCAVTDLVLYRSTERTPRYEAIASWKLLAA
ncbi:MAG TPA: RNA 2',3'-cyclic phosphodiesterase [Planctomycetota bacterium]|nr:RNA 2',3'-cyclic phosphodiesterase [Planctomycetota bacterium]